jgi:hypothetical protein
MASTVLDRLALLINTQLPQEKAGRLSPTLDSGPFSRRVFYYPLGSGIGSTQDADYSS